MYRLILTFISLLFFSLSAEELNTDQHIKNLTSGTDNDKIVACNHLGKEKAEKKAIPEIISLLKTTENPKVASAAAIALGYLKEKGASTTALKDKILAENKSDVVYACLLALMSISLQNKVYEPDAKAALQYADVNHRSDEFVADVIDKIKNKLKDSKLAL